MLPRLAGVPRVGEARNSMLLILTAFALSLSVGRTCRQITPAKVVHNIQSSAMDPRLRRG